MTIVRWTIYIAGLVAVVGATWIFLTQTELGRNVPGGAALAIILLIVGVGLMASAKSIRETHHDRVTIDDHAADEHSGIRVRHRD